MFKVLHLPTGTYLKCYAYNPTTERRVLKDWVFTSEKSARQVMSWKLIKDNNTEEVLVHDSAYRLRESEPVLPEHLELEEFSDEI